MRSYLIGAGMLAATAILAIAGSARADTPKGPPPNGWYGYMPGAYVVCDTKDQLKILAEVSASTQGKGLGPKLRELNKTPNDKGEASCSFMPLGGPFAVGESVDLGEMYTTAGLKAHSWAVHAGNSDHEWWFIFGVAAEDPPAPPKASFTFDQKTWTRSLQGI